VGRQRKARNWWLRIPAAKRREIRAHQQRERALQLRAALGRDRATSTDTTAGSAGSEGATR
jgi:hypothetical protein